MKKEEEYSARDYSNYTIGILSIVLAIITSWGIGGIILGTIGLIRAKNSKTKLSKKAKTLNLIGLIIGLVIFVISIIIILVSGFDWTTLTNPQ